MVPGDCHPSPLCLGSCQGPILLNVAGAASELKCTSGIFILLRDHHEKSFQWSRFCEEKSAVALFFLEAAEEAHLQNIRKKWWGRGTGTLHPAWTEPWMEMGGPERGWPFGLDGPPAPWKRKAAFPRAA